METWVHRFAPMAGYDRYSYWESFTRLWSDPDVGAIINVEHDMEYSDDLARELEACPEPLCTHAYRMYLPRVYWAHGYAPDDARRLTGEGIQWAVQGAERCDWSAIGFCKIAPEARTAPLARTEWPGVETSVNNAITGTWHIHWPGVAHYHREPREAVH